MAVARQTVRLLTEKAFLTTETVSGKETFYTTGNPDLVKPVIVKLWFKNKVEVTVEKTDL